MLRETASLISRLIPSDLSTVLMMDGQIVKDTTLAAEPSTETLAATTAHKQTLEPLGRFPKLDNQLSPPYLSLTPP